MCLEPVSSIMKILNHTTAIDFLESSATASTSLLSIIARKKTESSAKRTSLEPSKEPPYDHLQHSTTNKPCYHQSSTTVNLFDTLFLSIPAVLGTFPPSSPLESPARVADPGWNRWAHNLGRGSAGFLSPFGSLQSAQRFFKGKLGKILDQAISPSTKNLFPSSRKYIQLIQYIGPCSWPWEWPPQDQLMQAALGILCAFADRAPWMSTDVSSRRERCLGAPLSTSEDEIWQLPDLWLHQSGGHAVCRHVVHCHTGLRYVSSRLLPSWTTSTFSTPELYTEWASALGPWHTEA